MAPLTLQQLETRQKSDLKLGADLSKREIEVLTLVAEGFSNIEISRVLYITPGTVKTHVRSILNKLGAEHRTQAAVFAVRQGLV